MVRLALHHLLDEAHTGMGDAREELNPNLVGDVRPVAVKTVTPGFKNKTECITICMPGSSFIHIETS